jgi:hypothetical protein
MVIPWSIDDDAIEAALPIACKNWRDWRPEFEHGGHPLLAEPGTRFGTFCREYSVGRTIRAGTRCDFRRRLVAQLEAAIGDDTGHALDALEDDLRPDFGTHGGKSRLVSVLSKVAAFARPERFVAWDRYAKKGLNSVLGRPPSARFHTYAEYLAAFDCAWNGQPGQRIRDYLMRHGTQEAIEKEPRFQRRILDVCLMRLGGRPL